MEFDQYLFQLFEYMGFYRIHPKLPKEMVQFFKFGLIGTITAGIYFTTLWFLHSLFGLQYIIGVSGAYLSSTAFHFLASKHFTFKAHSGCQKMQLGKYMIVWCINYFTTLIVVSFCVEKLLLSPYLSSLISIFCTMCTGYFLSKHWVFKTVENI